MALTRDRKQCWKSVQEGSRAGLDLPHPLCPAVSSSPVPTWSPPNAPQMACPAACRRAWRQRETLRTGHLGRGSTFFPAQLCASLGTDGFFANTWQVPASMAVYPEVVALEPRQHPLYPVLAWHRPYPPDQLPATHRAPAARLNAAAAQP